MDFDKLMQGFDLKNSLKKIQKNIINQCNNSKITYLKKYYFESI